MRGAGGTNGGIGQFLMGFVMMCGGFYMLLNAIMVTSNFGAGMRLYGFNAFGGAYAVTSGVIASIKFTFRAMSAFDLIVILVLSAGGLGLFLRSLRDISMEPLE